MRWPPHTLTSFVRCRFFTRPSVVSYYSLLDLLNGPINGVQLGSQVSTRKPNRSPMGQSFNSVRRTREPQIRFPMDQQQPLYHTQTHIKLLGFDLNSLTQTSSSSSSSNAVSFSRKGYAVSCTEIVGVVVSRNLKPNRFLKFSVDDGTDCVGCILWLNHLTSPYFASRHQPDVRVIGNMATHFAAQIRVGIVARVRGRVSSYRGMVQITVSDVVVEDDPNAEILHWLDCMRLALKCYDLLPTPT